MRAATMVLALGVIGLVIGVSYGDPAKDEKPEAVRELKGVTASTKAKNVNKPTEISSEAEAAKVFDKDTLEKVKKLVDFNTEKLLCFDWAGSGQDSLSFKLDVEGDARLAIFTLTPGRTKDLRMHSRVFVLPMNAKWRVGDKK